MIDHAIAPLLYRLQQLLLDRGAGIYEASSIPVSVALVYLRFRHSSTSRRKAAEGIRADPCLKILKTMVFDMITLKKAVGMRVSTAFLLIELRFISYSLLLQH